MGQRFHLETITIDNLASASESLTNLYSTSTTASLPSLDSQTNTLNNSLSQLAPVREPFVTLPLEKYAEHESVALVDLLRSHFGIPQPAQFYFGGNTSGSTKNLIFSNPDLSAKSTSASQQQQKLLTKVPTLLPLLFHRPLSASKNVFHRTSVEVPLEIDIGFLVHPQTLVAAQKEHRCNHRVGTYFRLYGFVTQTEGRFITYTRCGSIWGEDLFWKCEDEVVSGPIELGTRVNSKGIVIALYRAEIKARG
ncbi:hypothetical protein HDU99_007703 [Rhizoclosmatium hyalinum]|nr:hypothetical protein HDU99_007703 [Rhizoclosmatium hyalinum]